MKPFEKITSNICPLDISNIDTDQIIPKQFLKRVERTGFGKYLFYDWRYNKDKTENTDFNLNKPYFKNAKILLARENFGCGSSREHAPWALKDYGFEVIIASSYADIFYNNCFQNGILPIILQKDEINKLFKLIENSSENEYEVDLENQSILSLKDNTKFIFNLDKNRKEKLLKGIDDIGYTLQFEKSIVEYENSIEFF
ncbi:MAG: 3-isopropylmalate dehydratase small subunit [Spirochaetia bacterium]|nr:3-isopropylmalate dehydratase small subunit [Spirochaetia bacterium]